MEQFVGTLDMTTSRKAAFQYSDEWMEIGFSISPFSLPLGKKVFLPQILPFDGIFGVFEDSLPDGWGRLLVDRQLLKHNINPIETESLDRLAIVGSLGMGALQYVPEFDLAEETQIGDFDDIARE